MYGRSWLKFWQKRPKITSNEFEINVLSHSRVPTAKAFQKIPQQISIIAKVCNIVFQLKYYRIILMMSLFVVGILRKVPVKV